MKKIYSKAIMAAFVAVIAAVGASCSSDEEASVPESDGKGLTEISLVVPPPVADEGSRTTLNPTDMIKWNTDDAKKMGLTRNQLGESLLQSSSMELLDDTGKSAKFTYVASSYDVTLAGLCKAFYPYFQGTTIVNMEVAVNQTQNQAGETTYGSASIPMISDLLSDMSAENIELSGKQAVLKTKMHVLSSIVAFYVYDSAGTHALEKVMKITLISNATNIAGVTSVNTGQADLPQLTGSSRMVSVSLASSYALDGIMSKAQSKPIYLSLIPSDFTGRIIVETDQAYYTFPFDTPKNFARAEVKDMPLNLSNEKVSITTKGSQTKPSISLVKLNRANAVTAGYNVKATLTVRRGNEETIGFYIAFEVKSGMSDTPTQATVLSGDIYYYGQMDDEKFTANGDAVAYMQELKATTGNIAFGVIPFDQFGNLGAMQADGGFGLGGRGDYTNF